jgi:hypothetical protein
LSQDRYISIDEEGYWIFSGRRVDDEGLGGTLLENLKLRDDFSRAVKNGEKEEALNLWPTLLESSKTLSQKLQREGVDGFSSLWRELFPEFPKDSPDTKLLPLLYHEFIDLGRESIPDQQKKLLEDLSEELAEELFPEDGGQKQAVKTNLKNGLGTASLSQYFTREDISEYFAHPEFRQEILNLVDVFQSLGMRAAFLPAHVRLIFKGGLDADTTKHAFKHEAIHFLAHQGLIKVDNRSEQFPHASQVLEMVKNRGVGVLDDPETIESFGVPVGDLFRYGKTWGEGENWVL